MKKKWNKIGEESEYDNDKNDENKDELRPIGFKNQKFFSQSQSNKYNQKRQIYHKRINIENKRKSFKYSSDNSATIKNVSPKDGKKNDAATNTQHDYSFTQDILSFHLGNNSPTFEGNNNFGMIGISSPTSKEQSAIDNIKDESDIISKNKAKQFEEDDTSKHSKLNTERRIGGGFKFYSVL